MKKVNVFLMAMLIATAGCFSACTKTVERDRDEDVEEEIESEETEFECKVEVGDTIEEVFEVYDLQAGDFSYDYEYDPYGDGCTDVTSGIYDGTLVDFKEESVMDYAMFIYFTDDNGEWEKINLNDNDPEDFKDVLRIYIDINANENVYEDYPENTVMTVEVETEW